MFQSHLIALVLGALVGASTATHGEQPEPAAVAPAPAEDVIRAFVAAFNAHDPALMLKHADPAIQWLSVDGASVSLEAEGQEALKASMTSYFASCPTCRSAIVSMATMGSRVAVLEEASWEAKGETRAQRSLAVYELRDGRILRVHYFPSER